MIAAIVDLDGTLYTGHILNGIRHFHRTHKVQQWRIRICPCSSTRTNSTTQFYTS